MRKKTYSFRLSREAEMQLDELKAGTTATAVIEAAIAVFYRARTGNPNRAAASVVASAVAPIADLPALYRAAEARWMCDDGSV